MNRIVVFTLFSFFSYWVSANEIVESIKRAGLTKQEPPTGGITSNKIKLKSYKVTLESNQLSISPLALSEASDMNSRETSINGYRLIGTDKGEWGGELTLYPPSNEPKVLLKDNITNIHRFNDSIYVITGQAHLGSNGGAVHELINLETNPELKLITLLPAAPNYVISDENRIYILTYDGLVSLEYWNGAFSIKIIVHNAPWNGFSPRSMVKIGKTFVIGMHTGVTVIHEEPWGNEINFYGK
ncbi:hypothetical protein NO559_14705 [Dasania sp. GY-MA-18]|uniref:Uncharacterized protein n=1 Tax=Dasania phycosphaerae TaxID=2950436 RepID=A0A9J6RQ26_9GAMM|nr:MULTISPECIES: hypothetical protein [Dasania]MCR8924031.1 hypothetical protein [Dasania sp. GY-MA-18]MCZ0866604.1 hypothetical protein [Dasania phycosphaerae]MCZ0870189.1 hypothetical protein [Dasania phycosphaerae]